MGELGGVISPRVMKEGTNTPIRYRGNAEGQPFTWRGNRRDAGRIKPDRFLANLKFGNTPDGGKAYDSK